MIQSVLIYVLAAIGTLAIAIGLRAFIKGFLGQAILNLAPFLGTAPSPAPKIDSPAKLEAQPICLTNVHAFVTINVQPGPELPGSTPSTVCLKRCDLCGLHIAPIHQGDWTLDDFTAKESNLKAFNAIFAPTGELR